MERKPVGVPGWESLSIHLSAGEAGLRHVLVTLDERKAAISASDHVLYCEGPLSRHENVGGRLEPDGRFLGTRWRTVTRDVEGKDDAEVVESVPTPATEADARAIKDLVAEVLRRVRQLPEA